MRELPETAEMFATFAPIDLTAPGPRPRAFTHEAALGEIGLEEILQGRAPTRWKALFKPSGLASPGRLTTASCR